VASSTLDFEEAGMETRTTTRLREQDRQILDKQTFAHLATLMPDGSPQVTPVWVDYEGDRIVATAPRDA
jgi:predicted pyridoxine 5'-phosphate oxidase superfamily flavin-nucleotide-binding protein